MSQINGLGTPYGMSDPMFLAKTFSAGQSGDVQGASFQKLMLGAFDEVAGLENLAQTTISENLAGGDITLAESVVAMREAELSMRLMMQIQRKLVDAWKELKNMQV